MPLMVHDLVPAFLDYWRDVSELPPSVQLSRWYEMEARYPLIANDARRMGVEPKAERALTRYPDRIGLIERNAPLAAGWIREAYDLVAPVLGAEHLDVGGYSLVGLAQSNGWVSLVDGAQTLFVAVEMVPDERSGADSRRA